MKVIPPVDNSKRVKAKTDHPPQEWAQSCRPRKPYSYQEVTILRDKPRPKYSPKRKRAPELFVLNPIHPELLALQPGESASFNDFVERLGLDEFLNWTFDEPGPLKDAWMPVLEPAPARPGVRPGFVEYDTLVGAWTDPVTVHAFTSEQEALREAMADKSPWGVASIPRPGYVQSFPISISIDVQSRIVYEQPKHIFARAWYELLDASLPARVCGYCHTPFMPTRTDQIYCPGRPCGDRAFRQRYDHTPYRMEYQRMHKRWKRGTMNDAAWEQWKSENQPGGMEKT